MPQVFLRQLGHLGLIRSAAFRPRLATGLALSENRSSAAARVAEASPTYWNNLPIIATQQGYILKNSSER